MSLFDLIFKLKDLKIILGVFRPCCLALFTFEAEGFDCYFTCFRTLRALLFGDV